MTALPSPAPRPWPAASLASLAGLILGAAVVATIGLLAGSGRFAGESPESKALKVLRADQSDVATTMRRLGEADRVAELRAVGDIARRAVERLRARDTALALIDDVGVQSTAQRAHRASITALGGIAGLAAVDRRHLDAWDIGERQVVGALGELDAVAGGVAAMDDTTPLRIDTRSMETAATAASAYLTASARKLARYERRMAAFRRRNRSKLQAAADYRASVQGQVAAYAATRKELQQYLDDVKDFDDRIGLFREQLQDARTKRQGIRGTLASMAAPPGLAAEHQALVAVLDKGIAGTEAGINLADATERLRDEGNYDTSGFDLPEYDRFVELSDQISRELSAATSTWTGSIGRYEQRLKHPKGAPEPPVI